MIILESQTGANPMRGAEGATAQSWGNHSKDTASEQECSLSTSSGTFSTNSGSAAVCSFENLNSDQAGTSSGDVHKEFWRMRSVVDFPKDFTRPYHGQNWISLHVGICVWGRNPSEGLAFNGDLGCPKRRSIPPCHGPCSRKSLQTCHLQGDDKGEES